MDYAKIASQVIEHVGGKQNIKSVQHCATRLRLQLKDNDLRNEDAVSDIEGVKGVFLTQSQFHEEDPPTTTLPFAPFDL